MTIQKSLLVLKTEGTKTCPQTISVRGNSEQQRVALAVQHALSDRVDAHITTRLAFQPAGFTATRLTKHPPAPHFRSTTLHDSNSANNEGVIIDPCRRRTSAFSAVFICQMDAYAYTQCMAY